jgi:hypothetical protein
MATSISLLCFKIFPQVTNQVSGTPVHPELAAWLESNMRVCLH